MKTTIKLLSNYKKNILNIFLSILGTYGILNVLEIINQSNNLINTFTGLLIFLCIFFVYKNTNKIEKSEHILLILYSIFLSSIIVIGTQLEYLSNMFFNVSTILTIFGMICAVYPLLIQLIYTIKKTNFINFKNTNKRKIFYFTFFFVFIMNFLVFLALYPGVYGYDAGRQILEILDNDVNITSHFPILYSFILANIVNLGKTIFGSYKIGFAIYSFLQMLFLDYVATKIIIYTVNKCKNIFIYIFNVLFFSFFPLFTTMVVSSSHDVIFSGIFALIILNVFDMIENEKYWDKKRNSISLVLLIFLLCAFRNNGFYCMIFTIPFILLFCKKRKKQTLLLFIIPLVIYKIYSGPVYNFLNVTSKNTIREMLSIPSQQFARVYTQNTDVISDENLKQLNKYYKTVDNFKYYDENELIADQAKLMLNNNAVKKDLKGYISLWINIGIKDPENYIEAFLLNSLGFWYPNKDYYDSRMYHPYIEFEMIDAKKYNKKYIAIERDSKFPLYHKILDSAVNQNNWKKLPVISSIFSIGTYFIIFTFLIGITIIRKNYKYLIPISIILGLYITLFLSPVALFRYCFPIIMISPIMITQIILQIKKEN